MNVSQGDEFSYQIVGADSGSGRQYPGDNNGAFNYHPHGVEDVDSMTISIRENADATFTIGEQYLFGTALAVCREITASVGRHNTPWSINVTKGYKFEVVEDGVMSIPVDNANLATHCSNPQWYDPTAYTPSGYEVYQNIPRRDGTRKHQLWSLNDLSPVFYQQIIYKFSRNPS